VKRAEEWLGETFLLEDPKAKLRELLQFNLKLLSDKDVRRVENARSSLAVSIANELWEQALSDGGNIAAMSELILFTAPGRYQGYRYATDKPYVEPEGWQELVARLYPSPELHHLRVRHMDNEEVILLAATALRTNQIIDAKIVMAYWNESAKIREVIPQDLIAQVVVLVERYNARQKITQVPAT
jgi:hypothetical protein